MLGYLIVAFIAYLVGSIPFGYILVRVFLGRDVRATGSGNIGATNVARTGAKGLAVVTLVLDAAKGAFAVWLVFWLAGVAIAFDPAWVFKLAGLGALFAVIGHMFPVWLKFRGGKGVATAVGAFGLLAPKAVLVALIVFVLAVAVTRYVSLGSMLAALVFPFAAWFFFLEASQRENASPALLAMIGIASALIIAKHHQNIRRLMAGTEHRLGGKPPGNPITAEKNA
jgi:glycerol-3-phosphate acyltransferase PlsY